MTRRAYVYFVITFIIGLVLGGAAMYYYAWGTGHWRRKWSEQRAVDRLKNDLALTPPQVRELRPILDENVRNWNHLQQQVRPQFDALRDQTDNEIRHILNPGQLSKFNALIQQHRRPAKKH
ncbi:MAG: hypothetical protein ACRD1N_05910 [Terriglobia bacterium]